MYRALLARLGYAQAPKLAALEFDLETDGRLDAFEAAFEQVTGKAWRLHRDTSLAVNSASRALHVLDPTTFPSPEAWSRDSQAPALTAKWFVRRAVELVGRRGGGATRLVFVVDEVSQYIARSIDRIRAMQAISEEFKSLGGRLWMVATGQERLEEVVEGLEGKQSELQRLRDRFPLTVDLLPSDINEVVGRRVLDKREEGRAEIARVLRPRREQLAANTRLSSETRATDPSEDDWIRLYPLVPYQVQLIIDAVSKRRSQVRTSTPMGGSNRTVIKHAQQLITSAKVGLGNADVGALVTVDRSYDLLEEVIPTSWRAEIDQVAAKYGPRSTATGNRHLRYREAIDVALDILDALVAIHPDSARLGELDEKRRNGELSQAEYAEWMELQEMGLVHRDIKPLNVILTRTGAKLLDFNIIASRAGDEVKTLSGTPPYQAPDADLTRWDVSTDLFSVGVVLYELLCDGHHPYPGSRPMAGESVIDPRTIRPDLTPELAEFLMKAFAPNREERFLTAQEMEGGLAAIRNGSR